MYINVNKFAIIVVQVFKLLRFYEQKCLQKFDPRNLQHANLKGLVLISIVEVFKSLIYMSIVTALTFVTLQIDHAELTVIVTCNAYDRALLFEGYKFHGYTKKYKFAEINFVKQYRVKFTDESHYRSNFQ